MVRLRYAKRHRQEFPCFKRIKNTFEKLLKGFKNHFLLRSKTNLLTQETQNIGGCKGKKHIIVLGCGK
jgi:hypothetical protein